MNFSHSPAPTVCARLQADRTRSLGLQSEQRKTKSGLTTFVCSQHFEEPEEGTGDITAIVAIVPPQ
jgi:hypothetical protein